MKIGDYGDPSRNIDDFATFVSPHKMTKVLDAGCGAGRNYVELAKRGYDVIGVDCSSDALKIAKEKAHEKGVPVKLVQADMKALPFRNGEFNAVYSNAVHAGVFIFGGDVEVQRTLREGSIIYVDLIQGVEHTDHSFSDDSWKHTDWKYTDRTMYNLFPEDTIRKRDDITRTRTETDDEGRKQLTTKRQIVMSV